ncbi:MAG: hypothetical protein KJ064_21370 [Anaerolineae bacterium]|nr:hypothetical protein [Anaerolineae bacterium]
MAKREEAVNAVQIGQNSAVINPYALAELVAGRKIPWKEIPDAPRVLESILDTPYEELFDPKYEGPLYTGLRLNERLELVPVRSPLLDVELKVDVSDLEFPLTLENIARLADLGPRFNTDDVGGIEVKHAEVVGQRYLQLTVRLPERERWQRLARLFTKDIVEAIAFDPTQKSKSKDWTPPNATWSDPGRFFNEAAEFFDPIQGAVANCYYIAALSAVAWAMPYRIRHLTRATGLAQEQFTNLIQFFKPDSNGQLDKEIEVTDSVPLNTSSGGFIYARSSEDGEIWPAVYEKAYAKLKTGISGDHPDITATGWGDCVWATAQLTGGKRHYYGTPDHSADQLWDIVRGNSISHRTFNPMTCWTYSSGDATEKKIVYGDANIVASHCYTVLGWDYRDNRKYIILRNPWGNTEAGVQTLNSTVWLYDISWWRPINLTTIDGTFAIEASAFKTYFAGIGVAK